MQPQPAPVRLTPLFGGIPAAFRKCFGIQERLTRRFDRLLPAQLRIDGNLDFIDDLVPSYVRPGSVVYDVGGGKNPLISAECKAGLGLRVIGIDIDPNELAAAPAGRYDDCVCADISRYQGSADADLVICQALLERVRDTERALAALASILKPGGRALIFVPSRNAVYARINLLLPQKIKRAILFGIYPERRRSQGFAAYYNRCTPARMEAMARSNGLIAEHRRAYFQSDYFRFCFPIHALWRLWLLMFRMVAGDEAAETFSLVLRKAEAGQQPEPSSKPVAAFGMNSMFAVRQFLPEILAAVQQRGLDVVAIAPRPAPPDAEALPEFPGVRFRFVSLKRELAPLSDLRALWQIWRILRSVRPAVTNMSTPKMGFLGGLAGCLAGVPHRVYTLRGLRYETTRSWKRRLLMACEKIACACAHQVICISRSVRQSALADRIATEDRLILLGERGSEGITIDPAGGIAPAAATRHLRTLLGIPHDAAVIGFVGRLTRDKGIGELVRCFQTLRRQKRAIHLLLLGDFESGDPVDQATAAYIRTGPNVHWPGFVPDPTPYYPLMDVFVFPTYREGMGKVLLEAAASGVPAVSTRVTGVIDVVVDGVTGILVPPGDANALAQAVASLLDDPSLAKRMARAGRQLIREHFDNSIYLERLATMLESLACGEPAPTLQFNGKE